MNSTDQSNTEPVQATQIQNDTEKFCIDCKSYTGWRWAYALEDDSGSCGFRAIRQHQTNSQCLKDLEKQERCPVTGTIRQFFKHINARAVRKDENACGLEGKWFEEYDGERERIQPAIPEIAYRKTTKKQITLDDLI